MNVSPYAVAAAVDVAAHSAENRAPSPWRGRLIALGSLFAFLGVCVAIGAWWGILGDAWERLQTWTNLDTATVLTGAMASMSCAVPGVFLFLRKQSMMGDALSHTVLPGIVAAFMAAHAMKVSGWISEAQYAASWHAVLFCGALLVGILAAMLTEAVQKLGNVEGSAALGVVFTTLFALGLVLVRLGADQIDLDADCVLYGEVLATQPGVSGKAIQSGVFLTVNVLLTIVCFKELRISSFDPAMATSLGISARGMHYAIMALTAATLVAAFESVGSILVIAMLIVPAATARLLTHHLWLMLVFSVLLAAASAVLGHALAITIPPIIFHRLGFTQVDDVSTTGMMTLTTGGFFVLAVMFSPSSGVLSRTWRNLRMSLQIAREDILGLLFRFEERAKSPVTVNLETLAKDSPGIARWSLRWGAWQLLRRGEVTREPDGIRLTSQGRETALRLVQAHRLWETFMAEHFDVPENQLHPAASRVEHFLDDELREQLETVLHRPDVDPHGQPIPRAEDGGGR